MVDRTSCPSPLYHQAPRGLFTWVCSRDVTQRETEAPKGTSGHIWGSACIGSPLGTTQTEYVERGEEGVLSQGVGSSSEILGSQVR